jgi:hypothetical protein
MIANLLEGMEHEESGAAGWAEPVSGLRVA